MPEFLPLDRVAEGHATLPPPIPPAPVPTTVIALAMAGLDAQPAICVARHENRLLYAGDPLFGEAPVWETHYQVLGAEELPIGTDYPRVAARINTLARRLYNADSRGDYHVLADASGVGRPVIDAIRNSILAHVCVTAATVTTGDQGDLSILWRQESTIGLAYLVSRLRAILQGRRLHMPPTPETDKLLALLHDYDLDNDRGPDPVRALALACSSEFQPVRYGTSPNLLPSPRL